MRVGSRDLPTGEKRPRQGTIWCDYGVQSGCHRRDIVMGTTDDGNEFRSTHDRRKLKQYDNSRHDIQFFGMVEAFGYYERENGTVNSPDRGCHSARRFRRTF